MTSTRTTTITLRLSRQLLDRIDDNAKRAGDNRNSYIASWLNYACDTSVVFAGENGTAHKRRVTRGFQPAPQLRAPASVPAGPGCTRA
jgi:hypothetical protein